jgi:hypothetical protein
VLQIRCNQILESLDLGPVRHHHGWQDSARLKSGAVREIALVPARDCHIVLMLYPGDSIVQAREFFDGVSADRFLELPARGWSVRPNLHFAFIQTNLYWPRAQVPLEKYLAFWAGKSAIIQKWDRGHFEEVFERLLSVGQLLRQDVDELRKIYTDSSRNSLNLCPGFELLYRWPADGAATLESQGLFAPAVREKIVEAFNSWGQCFPHEREKDLRRR